ncbi:MAG: GMC family oxidoreductase [Parvibaculaceae bacterium]
MEECDYLIIGGGSAGCILAARLAERTQGRIILLEAGPSDENDPLARDLSRLYDQTPGYDWGFRASPLRGAPLELDYSRARMLGGCANHNDCAYLVPPDCDFDAWRDRGARGWGAQDVRPYFRRLDRKVKVETPTGGNPVSQAFIDACIEAGFPFRRFREGIGAGTGWFPLNIDGKLRQSTSAAYLHPLARLPRHLEVWTETFAERLMVEEKRCVGAATSRGPIRARREVLLTAGAILTPQLLMLSGIGPADELGGVGIAPLHDLPGVGRHLIDHVASGIVWDLHEPVGPCHVTPYEATLLASIEPEAPAPDVLYHFGLRVHDKSGVKPRLGNPENGVKLAPNVTRARSEGRVTLASPDPRAAPVIDLNYFSDPEGYDLRILCAAMKLGRGLADKGALQHLVRTEVAPGPEIVDDADLSAYIREVCDTVYHASGTCRMGDADAPTSVVTPDLKVIGIEALRVCDASVFPSMVTVNINNTVMMVAEKAADHVLPGPGGS